MRGVKAPNRRKFSRTDAEGVPSDLDDEIDAFAKARDRISLEKIDQMRGDGEGSDVDEDDDEVPVLDISDESGSEDDGGFESDEAGSSESDDDEIVEKGLREGGKVAKREWDACCSAGPGLGQIRASRGAARFACFPHFSAETGS